MIHFLIQLLPYIFYRVSRAPVALEKGKYVRRDTNTICLSLWNESRSINLGMRTIWKSTPTRAGSQWREARIWVIWTNV